MTVAKKKPQGQKAAANDLETEDDFPTPGSDDQVDQAATAAAAQEKYEDQGPASAPEPVKPKPEPARGKRPPAGAYENHPKFAKFKKGT